MKILIVDDDKVDRLRLKRMLEEAYSFTELTEVADYDSAVAELNAQEFDILLVDYHLTGHTALELLHDLKERVENTAIVIISQNQDPDVADQCIDAGAQDFLSKEEISAVRLNTAVRHARHRADLLQQLVTARDKEMEANKQKTRFLRGITHELITPLNAMVGFSRYLATYSEKLDLSERELKAFTAIVYNGEHAVNLINQLKDIDAIERNVLAINPTQFDIDVLIKSHAPTMEMVASKKSLNVEVKLPDHAISIVSDRSRVLQIINHLVDNAVRHTEHGSITVRLAEEEVPTLEKTVTLSVTDTGSGMTEDIQKALFHQFGSISDDMHHNFSGAGLGLYFCSRLMPLLNGQISFTSELGVGSTFTVHLKN